MGFQNFNLGEWLETMVVLIVAITIHEFAHALAADRAGDPTPRSQGRLTLNPADHLDPLGTVLMALSSAIGFGVGWGKPVQYNPYNLKRPRWDQVRIAIWGPISNIFQALLFAGLLRLDDKTQWLGGNDTAVDLLRLAVYVNITLAVFNMIPIPPLDGSKIFSGVLSRDNAQRYDRFAAQWGFLLFAVLIFSGATSFLIGPPTLYFFHILVGG